MIKFNWLRWVLYLIVALLGTEVLKVLLAKFPSPVTYLVSIIMVCLQTLFLLGFLYYALFAVVFGKKLSRKKFFISLSTSFVCLVVLLEVLFTAWLYHPAAIPAGLQWSYKYYYDLYNFRIMQYEKDAIAFDDRLLYTLRPDTTFNFSNVEFNTTVSINKARCRDNDSSAVAPEIICLGDSFTMGWGVDESQSFPSIIEKVTGKKTLNAGTPSYGTARELLLLERLDTSKLKYIIIQYCSNDLEENTSFVENGYNLKLTPRPVFKSTIRAYELSRKYFPGKNFLMIANLWMKCQVNRIYPLFKLYGQPYEGEFDSREHASVFLKVLMKIHERFRNITLIVTNVDVFKYRDNRFIDELRRQAGEMKPEKTENIIFVNTMNGLNDSDYFILDYHINSSGHKKVAAKLVEVIEGNPPKPVEAGK